MIIFDRVTKRFKDGKIAVNELSFEVYKKETLVLLGRSGSGKTTTMKMINRLIDPTTGAIYVEGNKIADLDPIELRRKIGYAIQSIGLFPHMSVGENIAIGLRLLKWSKRAIEKRTNELLEMVGLPPGDFMRRYPHELSGGQRQRVGVARALAADPPIVLMDEPFGALDPITRHELQDQCIRLFAGLGKTVVFVTHDVFEAAKMGDRIALFDEGNLVTIDTPENLVCCDEASEFIEHHRFQLTLLTQTLGKKFPDLCNQSVCVGKSLSYRHSLIEALDVFKQTNALRLPVYAGKKYLGALDKSDLLDEIIKTMLAEKEGVSL